MRRMCIIFALLLMTIPAFVQGKPVYPKFLNIEWGSSREEVVEALSGRDFSFYERGNKNQNSYIYFGTFAGFYSHIELYFYENRFYKAEVTPTPESSNGDTWLNLFTGLKKKYGNADFSSKGDKWEFDEGFVNLYYYKAIEYIVLTYQDHAISKLAEHEAAEKAEAERLAAEAKKAIDMQDL